MKQYIAAVAALTIALTPAFAMAMAGPRGGGGGGGGARGGGGGRPSAAARPSGGQRPASRPAPQTARPSGGGFNLKGDTKPSSVASRPATRPAGNPSANRPGNAPSRGNGNGNNKPGNAGNKVTNNGGNKVTNNGGNKVTNNKNNGNHTNVNTGNRNNINVSGNTINRTVVSNPVYGNGGAWGWNHGSAWAPAPNYWGGGFWGAMAVGATSAAIYGSIVSSANHATYTSYQVQPSSPGATVLSNYQLTQTQCGGSGLVVIYGPSNSVICANPNSLVSAGNYNLDTSTLSLTSA